MHGQYMISHGQYNIYTTRVLSSALGNQYFRKVMPGEGLSISRRIGPSEVHNAKELLTNLEIKKKTRRRPNPSMPTIKQKY